MLILQMGHHIIGPFLLRVKQVQNLSPMRNGLPGHLHNLLVTHVPMVCV